MKDIEKIKSEDLACQVADANPANFAIEQEVAQLVGATVPQPTEPSADDARELGAQLLVFLRRALTPIQTALRTAVAAIYAHLDSRCTDYTPAAYDPFRLPAGPYDPMRPLTPRTLPNLLTALTAFDDRKISNGSAPSDGIPDGTSLAHCIYEGVATEIGDDNAPWKLNGILSKLASIFPLATKVTLNCEEIEFTNNLGFLKGASSVKQLFMPYLRKMTNHNGWYEGYGFSDGGIESLSLPKFEEYSCDHYGRLYAADSSIKYVDFPAFRKMSVAHGLYMFSDCSELLEVNVPSFSEIQYNGAWYSFITNCPKIRKVVVGKLAQGFPISGEHPNLIDFTIGNNYDISLNMSTWSPTLTEANTATFLQNFREHIALRLTANGTGLTLTLSQAVFSAVIEGSSPICDDIKGIIEDKGWKVQDTNNNIFPTT